MTTRHPLRCVPLIQTTNFPALEQQVLFERRHCADKPNKCKAAIQNQSIAVPIITGWSFYWKQKIIEMEDVVTEKYMKRLHGGIVVWFGEVVTLVLISLCLRFQDRTNIIKKIIFYTAMLIQRDAQRSSVYSAVLNRPPLFFHQQRKKKRKKLLLLNWWSRRRLRSRTRRRKRKVLHHQWPRIVDTLERNCATWVSLGILQFHV